MKRRENLSAKDYKTKFCSKVHLAFYRKEFARRWDVAGDNKRLYTEVSQKKLESLYFDWDRREKH